MEKQPDLKKATRAKQASDSAMESSLEQRLKELQLVSQQLTKQAELLQSNTKKSRSFDDLRQHHSEVVSHLIDKFNREIIQLSNRCNKERKTKELYQHRLKKFYQSSDWFYKRMTMKWVSKASFGLFKPLMHWKQYNKAVEAKVAHHVKNNKSSELFSSDDYLLEMPEIGSQTHQPQKLTKKDPIHVGIASVSWRMSALETVLNSIYDQVDTIHVYCNDYETVPIFLKRKKIRIYQEEEDLGDVGKFFALPFCKGYYLTIDDDILYPSYYVASIINAIEQYHREAIVSWHGSVITEHFTDYYDKKSRLVYPFGALKAKDEQVHVLGTGCMGFHTDTFNPSLDLFETVNMADVYVALAAQELKIPLIQIRHDKGEAQALKIPNDRKIHSESARSVEGSRLNTRERQSRLVGEHTWHYPPLKRDLRKALKVGYLGRTDAQRWKKGGILKSAQMIRELVLSEGNIFLGVDVEQDFNTQKEVLEEADVLIIYLGDLTRPDFAQAQQVIDYFKDKKPIIINLSYNKVPERTQEIVDYIQQSNLFLMLFTESSKQIPEFSAIKDRILVLPKTIRTRETELPSFYQTEGIFLGDYSKNINADLVDYPIEDWIAALRKKLPDAPIYLVRQYGGKLSRELENVEVVPYMEDQFHSWMAQRRVVACLTPYATYEMVPVEAAGLGIPLVYTHMEQSLTEAIGSSGVCVSTPEDFAEAVYHLYTDPSLWRRFSVSSMQRVQSQETQYTSALFHLELQKCMRKFY